MPILAAVRETPLEHFYLPVKKLSFAPKRQNFDLRNSLSSIQKSARHGSGSIISGGTINLKLRPKPMPINRFEAPKPNGKKPTLFPVDFWRYSHTDTIPDLQMTESPTRVSLDKYSDSKYLAAFDNFKIL
jgi:hypothetical protein